MPQFFLRILILFPIVCSLACSQQEKKTLSTEETYFSVSQFLDDQWNNLLGGQPFTLTRVTRFNDRRDSSFVPLDSLLWQKIRSKLDAGDISAPTFLGQYEFTFIEESVTSSYTFYYEAKSPDLFTRKLSVEVDAFNGRVRSVYMETEQKNRIYSLRQKIFYVPRRLIQIHEVENAFSSPEKNLMIEYYF